MLLQTVPGVRCDAKVYRLPAGGADQSDKGVSVAARDLAPAQYLLGSVYIRDLVAAAENRDPRSAVDQRMSHRDGGEHAQVRGAQLGAGRQNLRALPDVLAHQAEVDAHVAVLENRDRLGTAVGVLLPDDAVAALGQRGSGEDPGAL